MVKLNLFLKLFPPPKYLEQPALGLDISDRSIKFCQLSLGWNGLEVKQFGERPIETGVIEAGRIKQPEKLQSLLRELKKAVGVESVILSLPEEPAYIIKLNLPPMRQSERRESIELQLEENIPLPAEAVIFDYEVVAESRSKNNDNWNVIVSAIPKEVVAEYYNALRAAAFWPVSFEIEAHAIARAIIPQSERETMMIVDFGKTRTSFFITRGQQVIFTSTVSHIGGEDINRSIQKNLETTYAEAERLKREQGLLYAAGDNRLLVALVPLVAALRDEINKFSSYWNTRPDHEEHSAINKILLCGGQAQLPGLLEYLALSLEVEVALADIWINLLDPRLKVPPIAAGQTLNYATSLGLALKHFDHFAKRS